VDRSQLRDGRDELDRKIDDALDRVGTFIGFWLRVLLVVGIIVAIAWIVFVSPWAALLAAPALSFAWVLIQIAFAVGLAILLVLALFGFFDRGRISWFMPGETGVGLQDYKGNPEVLDVAVKVVTVLRGARQPKTLGGELDRGLLLSGPPGSGKRYLAQCIATEAAVPLGWASAWNFQNTFIGNGNRRLGSLYRGARKRARKFGACIVFIDEIDAIGVPRGQQNAGAPGPLSGTLGGSSGLLGDLLRPMDRQRMDESPQARLLRAMGLRARIEDRALVLTIGSTSLIDGLDPELMGPGCLDWKIVIAPPDFAGRREILQHYLDKVPHDSDLALDRLAIDMDGYAPAAIKRAVNEAVLVARGDGRGSVEMRDLLLALSLRGTSPGAPRSAASPSSLLIATTSAGKIRELTALLAAVPARLVTPTSLGITLDVEETGSTYEENARLKATAYARAAGIATLAEDSGLEIDALGGEPGVYSARYRGLPDGPVKNANLLELLHDVPAERRTCRYVCSMVYIDEEGREFVCEGRCEGRIATEPRGSGGFGFDPIVFIPEVGATMAELPEEEKNRISHRARAAQQLVAHLSSV
jgi:non-canonical purine NTP pyrophosphatase (RdgB/HAM1 family)